MTQMNRRLELHIWDLLNEHNMSLRELSRKTDIGHARLSELANGKKQRIQIDHILKIAEVFDITDIRQIITIELD